MTDEIVSVTVENGIGTITLNEEDKKNAITRDVSRKLIDIVNELEKNDHLRCVVITGSNNIFSAGGDIKMMLNDQSKPATERIKEGNRTTGRAIWRIATLNVPTIAKISGPAVGAGANLAIACDIQLACNSSSIGFVFRRIGACVDTGTSYFLPRLVGLNIAKGLVYTGDIISAEKALDVGLFNKVYLDEYFDERCDEIIQTIATGPTVALSESKRLLDHGFEKSLYEAIEDEGRAQASAMVSRDHQEGVQSFIDDRDPEFEGR